jgi:hypothetical protein
MFKFKLNISFSIFVRNIFFFLAAFVCNPTFSQTVSDTYLDYDPKKALQLGSGIDMLNFGEMRSQCITSYNAEFETTGAMKTQAKIHIVDTYKKLTEILDLGVDYSLATEAGWAAYKASGKFNNTTKFNDFRNEEASSLMVVIEVSSDYGKRVAKNYELEKEKEEFIINKEFNEFINRCGTHTIIGEVRKSQIALVINIKNLNESGKKVVKLLFDNTFKGSGNIEGIDAGVEGTTKLDWSKIIESSNKIGSVSAEWFSFGGEGIPNAGTIVLSFTKDLEAILKSISELSQKFTQNNSGIVGYLLLNNRSLGLTPPKVDYEVLQKIYTLQEVLGAYESAIKEIEVIKEKNQSIYRNYFQQKHSKLALEKQAIINHIDLCFSGDKACLKADFSYPESILLADFIEKEGSVAINC